jgi:hypothetical protein
VQSSAARVATGKSVALKGVHGALDIVGKHDVLKRGEGACQTFTVQGRALFSVPVSSGLSQH